MGQVHAFCGVCGSHSYSEGGTSGRGCYACNGHATAKAKVRLVAKGAKKKGMVKRGK